MTKQHLAAAPVRPLKACIECDERGAFGLTLGWTFSVLDAITIDGIGTWDQGADGLGVASQPLGLIADTYTTIADIEYGEGVYSFPDTVFTSPVNSFGGPNLGPTMRLATLTVPVPEPGTLALLGLGLVGLVARRRRTH